MSQALAQLDKARQLLAESRTLPEVKKIRDIAEAARVYAKAANLGTEAQNYAAEIALLAARKAGEILKKLERDNPGSKKKGLGAKAARKSDYAETLKDTKTPVRTAQRWQELSEVPEKIFENYVQNTKEISGEITGAGLLQHAHSVLPRKNPTPLRKNVNPVLNMVIQGDAFHIPIAEESVQMVMTSPPYFGLRSYEGNKHDGFGREKTVGEYVEHTIAVLRELRRVLRPDGIIFWNVGDSYNGNKTGNTNGTGEAGHPTGKVQMKKDVLTSVDMKTADKSIQIKSLCLIPERIAIAAQQDGWIVRDIIVWQKPNCIPESVRDRCTRSYEVIVMLVKQSKYFWNTQEAVEPSVCFEKGTWGSAEKSLQSHRSRLSEVPGVKYGGPYGNGAHAPVKKRGGKYGELKLSPPIGNAKHQALNIGTQEDNRMVMRETRNLRNVWTIPTANHRESHVAMFPEALAERAIRCGSQEGDTVFDPFAGSGTTGLVAKSLKRGFVLMDISKEYVDLMKSRNELELKEKSA